MHRAGLGFVGLIVAVAFPLAAGAIAAQDATPAPAFADLSPTVDHPYFPLASVSAKPYLGEELDPETGETTAIRVEETVRPGTAPVAGIAVTVVDVKEYEDGELVEATEDYYAQGPDGTVYYLGERVDDYEDGQVVDHSGQWLAGEGGTPPGLFLPADPAVGQTFAQEQVPGVAEDRSTVIARDRAVTTPAGTFAECLQTEDVNPLAEDGGQELKYYCPGVGLVREESADTFLDLVRFEGGPPATPTAARGERT